jgi:death-on-curing protein
MKREPAWLLRETVLSVQHRQLAEHGGPAGIRDEGLLDAALARPRQLWAYRRPRPDIASLGAAYAAGIIRGHPFIDGNKRTGYVACRLFLRLNGRDLKAGLTACYVAILGLADGSLEEAAFERWVRENSGKLLRAKR